MDEIQLIRHQLAAERQRVSAVANACAGALERAGSRAVPSGPALEEFRHACADYLVCVLAWFEERDQRLSAVLESRSQAKDPTRHALQEALAQPGRSREALGKLEAALAATAASRAEGSAQRSWQAFAHYFSSVWGARRDALDTLLAPNSRVADWRSLAGIDADSILEERQRYQRVCAMLPVGVTLAAAAAAAG